MKKLALAHMPELGGPVLMLLRRGSASMHHRDGVLAIRLNRLDQADRTTRSMGVGNAWFFEMNGRMVSYEKDATLDGWEPVELMD